MRTLVVMVALCGSARLGRADEPTPPPPSPETPVAPPEPPPSPASVLFDEGRALLDAKQPAVACEKFKASLELEPDSLGTILNLGLCNEEQDKVATALRWFRRAQARASELKKPDTEAAAKDRTTALAVKVPTLKIAFSSPPPAGTIVTLDGARVDAVDYNRIEVDAGSHEVAMTAPKILPTHETVTIVDAATRTITVTLASSIPPTFTVIDRGASRRKRAYIVGGVGAALLIGDTLLALKAKHEFEDTDVLATRDTWKNVARYGATSMFLVGGAAIGTAIYWYLTAPGTERVEDRTMVAPAVARDQIGVSLSRTF